MTKRRIIKHAIEAIKDKKKGIEKIEEYLKGMPALIFTKENPFSLVKTLKKSKTSAPAKAGQTAPFDIIVPKGPTSFAPGPVIGELAMLGIKSGVENGKVAIKEDSVVVKEGEKISAKAAEVLTRLGVKPMEVGLNVTAVYENGDIFTAKVLDIDEDKFKSDLTQAATWAYNLAIDSAYTTKDTINVLIGKAFNDAKALGLSQDIIDEGIIDELLGKAERSALSLKSTAKIETVEKPKVEEKKEEKPEPKKETSAPKVEEKPKETPTPTEKEEEKVLEEEKEIIKEEKEIIKEEKEIAKPKIEAPVEKLLSTGEKGLEMPTAFQKEVQKEVAKEEEKQLEKERIEKEKEFERIEAQKKAEEIKKIEEEKKRKGKEERKKQEEEKKAEETRKLEEQKKAEEKAKEEKRILEEEKRLEEEAKKTKIEAPVEKEVEKEVKEEEEKQLEKERLEEVQEPMDDTDKKIQEMVAKTKKFVRGEIPNAEKLIEEAGKLAAQEMPKKESKTIKKPKITEVKKVPKVEKKQEKKKEHEEVENLAQELIKKGTLRK